MVAEFEADLIRCRTREVMQLRLNPRGEAHLVELLGSGEYTTAEAGDLFGVTDPLFTAPSNAASVPRPAAMPA